MRDWKFLLTSQIARGQWFLHHDWANAGMADVQMLLNPLQDLTKVTGEILSQVQPIPFLAATSDDHSISSGYDSLPQGSIAIFKMSGTLLKYGTMCSYGTEEIGAMMEAAAAHKNIAGCFFEGDSGGGGVNAVSPIRAGFNAFKKEGKSTLAWVDSAYSAMYYSVSLADAIFCANNISSGLGSIGVMMSYMDVQEYYSKMGIVVKNIYAPESTEKNKSFELLMAGKDESLRIEELSPLAKAFQRDVIADRGDKLKYTNDPKILAGKTYGAELAVANGLADGIATRDEAIERLFQLIAVKNYLNNQ